MKLHQSNSERYLPALEAMALVDRDADIAAYSYVERAVAVLSDQDLAIIDQAVAQGWGGRRIALAVVVEKHSRGWE